VVCVPFSIYVDEPKLVNHVVVKDAGPMLKRLSSVISRTIAISIAVFFERVG
jgi:hypothetical protein